MKRALLIICIAFVALPAQAAVLTLSNGNATFGFDAFPAASTDLPALAFFRADGSADSLFQYWWHYRQPTDSREFALSNPMVVDSNPLDGLAQLNFNVSNFTWQIDLELTDGLVPNWATVRENWNVAPTDPSGQIDLQSINYLDIDVQGASGGNEARRIPATFFNLDTVYTNGVQVFDSVGGVVVNYRTDFAHIGDYHVAPYPAVRSELTDAAVTFFDDSGLPFTNGDFTAAFNLENNGSYGFSTDRVIEIRPVETLNWVGGGGSFSDPQNWAGTTGDGMTTLQSWRIANYQWGFGGSTTVDENVVVRQLNIRGGSSYGVLILDTPRLLGVTTDTTIDWSGILYVQDGIFYTHSLLAANVWEFEHTNGQVIIDGGTFDLGIFTETAGDYSIDGATAANLPTLVLKNGASATIPHTLFVGDSRTGELKLESGSTLTSFNGRVGWDVNTSYGYVTVEGPGSRWTNSADLEIGVRNFGQLLIRHGGLVENTDARIGAVAGAFGEVFVQDAGRWDNSGDLYVGGSGSGQLHISNGGIVSADDIWVWESGWVELDDGVITTNRFELQGGTLVGKGTIQATNALINASVIGPNLAAGELTVLQGDYRQTIDGTLAIEIGGTSLSEYDRLTVRDGMADLHGTLAVSLIDLAGGPNVFMPSAGDEFRILTTGSGFNGTRFDDYVLPSLPGGLYFDGYYDSLDGSLSLFVGGIAGDYNRNGVVDAADYVVWRKTYSGPNIPPTSYTADGDGDGDVDENDYAVWRSHFGQTAPPIGSATSSISDAIPEPTILALLSPCGLILLGYRHWTKNRTSGCKFRCFVLPFTLVLSSAAVFTEARG